MPPQRAAPGGAGERTVFVTVGTTCFDPLIRAVDQQTFADVLVARGYTRLVMQIGRCAAGAAAWGSQLAVAATSAPLHTASPGAASLCWPAIASAQTSRPPCCAPQGGVHATAAGAAQPAHRAAAQRAGCGVL